MKVFHNDSLTIHCIPDGPLMANTYWIDTGTTSCLVDPALQLHNQPQGASRLSLIVATHGHFDHILSCDQWRDAFPVKLAIHALDASALTDPAVNGSSLISHRLAFRPADILLADGQVIELDSAVSIQVIHTPGHTPGGICLLILQSSQPQALLTGDTLFAGSIGRTDLPGGRGSQLVQSLQRLVARADEIGRDSLVLPGHGEATTLHQEILSNPWLDAAALKHLSDY
jgi:glyoxylase-like metal-dependent hydrolase (beta-lactamase superfamily II)